MVLVAGTKKVENVRAKGEKGGGKKAFIEVYIEIEYNRDSFKKLLNKNGEK